MNPNTKVFINGKQLTRTKQGRFTSFKAKITRALYILKVATAALALFAIAVLITASMLATSTVTASTEIVQTPVQSPVLDRIARCESNGQQYGTSGQVLIKPNTNGTVDIGKYQINSVWFAKATELHLDLTKEADNKAMAEWIYANKGTGDWSSSSHCWNH